MRLLLTGGGTAGHINPAVAIANIVSQKEKSEILFIGTEEGMEKDLVPVNGYKIKFIKIHGFERKLSFENIKVCAELLKAVGDSKKIIKEFMPDVVAGTGGYVTGPVLYAAAKMKIPTLVHESNAYPGVTVRLLSDKVDIVALAMKAAEKYLKNPKRVEITGNPIRSSIMNVSKEEARKRLGIGEEKKAVLIFAGSLGAEYFGNIAADYAADTLKKRNDIFFIISSGKNNRYESLKERFKERGIDAEKEKNLIFREYIYDMENAINAADLIIARSGSSVSETLAAGKPSVLIPSPNVAGNHQEHNARAVEAAGAAKVITEDKLNLKSLKETADNILDNKAVLDKMSAAAKAAAITDAAERLYSLLNEIKNKTPK